MRYRIEKKYNNKILFYSGGDWGENNRYIYSEANATELFKELSKFGGTHDMIVRAEDGETSWRLL